VCTTGLVLQELLQGFRGSRARDAIVDRFRALPFLRPERDDHVEPTLLTTDRDFERVAELRPLEVWRP